MKRFSSLETLSRVCAMALLTFCARVSAQTAMPQRDGSGDAAPPSPDQSPNTGNTIPSAMNSQNREATPAANAASLPVTMPKAVTTPVTYPISEHGPGQVLLEITVDVDGRASNPKVLRGVAAFATAAIAAVKDWHFLPARRGNAAVSARIRFLVRFEPPIEVDQSMGKPREAAKPPPGTSSTSRAPPKQPGTPDAQTASPQAGPLEVTITGERPEAAVVSMGRADVEQMPGAFGDPFRAIDSLPGVTPMVSGLPFFFIRGAPPGNQGYFLDGIRVPLLYHLAAGPGVIHPALVDRVDLYAGGYPARYGRFAGAVVTGESKDPLPEYHAQGSIRLVDSGAFVTAPLGNGAIALGGRYSYTAAIVSLIVPQIKIDYWDYQAKAVQYLSDRDTVGVFAFGSLDLLQDKTSNSPEAMVGTEFHRIDLRYQRRISDATQFRSAVTLGLDKTLAGEVMTVRDRMLAVRGNLEHRFSATTTLRVGFDSALDAYDVILPVPDASNARLRQAIPERKDTVAGVWLDLPFQPAKRVTLVPGVRLDHYWSAGATALAVEPRVSATFALRRYLRLVHTLGLAQQPPSFVVPIPGLQISGLDQGLQRSLQSSAGVEWDLPSDVTATGTLFQNSYFNVTDQLSTINRTDLGDDYTPNKRSRGRTIGAELLVRRSFSQRVGGLLAYTLSKSWRSVDGERHDAAFDRRHVIQAALAFNLGRNWRSSIRTVVYSGVPARVEEVPTSASATQGSTVTTTQARLDPDRFPRTPIFYRLDLRMQKRWLVGKQGAHWGLTFEMLNATLRREAVSQTCNVSGSCRTERIGPVAIPSIGLEASY